MPTARTSLDLTQVLEVLGHISLVLHPSSLPLWEHWCRSSDAMLMWVWAPGTHRRGSHPGILAVATHIYALHSPPSCRPTTTATGLGQQQPFSSIICIFPLSPPWFSAQMQRSVMPWCCFVSSFWGMPSVKQDFICVLFPFKTVLTQSSPSSHLQICKVSRMLW